MQGTKRAEHAPASLIEPVYIENTLLRVFGVLFCHDKKRARLRKGTIAIDKGVRERNISVRLDSEYAQPGPFAHKVAMAILRKQSAYGRPAKNRISFSQRELGRLVGRETFGGRDSDDLTLALRQIRYTHVLAHFKREDRLIEHDFSIFNEVLLERRELPTDPIVACTVVLADPIIKSLDDRHFTCLNYSRIQELGTIGQALYMRLFFHFATHFDGHHQDRVVFRKRYDDICAEWLGGITVLKHRSKILGEQLGSHLEQLKAVGFLRGYELTPAEQREGFVLTFRPGRSFFADYERFYTRRARATGHFVPHDDAAAHAHHVAYLFVEKLTGKKRDAVPYVSSRDVATANELLAKIPFEKMPEFLDYALKEARKTRFDVKTLGAVRQYLNSFLQREALAASQANVDAARAAEELETRERIEYGAFRRAEIDSVFARLSAKEKATIDALAAAEVKAEGRTQPYMRTTLLKLARARITGERHPRRLTSFAHWKRRQPNR